MRVGWHLLGLQLHKVVCSLLILQLHLHGCLSVNHEGLALLAFWSRVEIDPFGALRNWDLEDENPCSWNGVYCVDGRVDTLNLQGLNLGGKLAPELGKLGHLKALLLSMNNFTGVIPTEFKELSQLELLDLRSNNFSGPIPLEIGELPSIKCLLLCENNFEAAASLWIENSNIFSDLRNNRNLPCDVAGDIACVNRKVRHCIWQTGLRNLKNAGSLMIPFKGKSLVFLYLFPRLNLRRGSSHKHEGKLGEHSTYLLQHGHDSHSIRRHLLEEARNLPAAPVSSALPSPAVAVPSQGSGTFAAVSNGGGKKRTPEGDDASSVPNQQATSVNQDEKSGSSSWRKWTYTVILLVTALLLISIMVLIVALRRRATTIGPWKTGISGQLQKAFVTGVPKLNRAELEAACEDFSNIVITYPNCTVFKGTLSSGVEIAVVSTKATSMLEWSDRSEMQFRNKIGSLSRINHKNFVNLLGYCQEDDPFMRMMVFEYAPNGTLFEHLHVKEFEHLDWSARMRIIMGIAYCLQHMHDLNPAVVHPILLSSAIFITDDYAAKIADLGIFSEPVEKVSLDGNKDSSMLLTAYPESNVYSFGILLLEIISGRMPISEEDGLPILSWAAEYLKEKNSINSLVDPSLKTIKDHELKIICEVAQSCICEDPRRRPTMKEATSLLREFLGIAPEAATPRLSPLWWAELEILSVEAS